jgi:hypothetical protein
VPRMESRCRDEPVPALAPGGQITRPQATFDHVSRYVWHCRFLDYEDNGRLRRWQCLPC